MLTNEQAEAIASLVKKWNLRDFGLYFEHDTWKWIIGWENNECGSLCLKSETRREAILQQNLVNQFLQVETVKTFEAEVELGTVLFGDWQDNPACWNITVIRDGMEEVLTPSSKDPQFIIDNWEYVVNGGEWYAD